MLIVLSTACGWFIAAILITTIFYPLQEKKIAGIRIQGIIPAHREQLADAVASSITRSFLNQESITRSLSSPGIMQKLQPEIEAHVDHFLQEKIKEAFPLLYKFMGEKTLEKFKAAFMTEVEVLFPVLIRSYAGIALGEMQPEKMLAKKINELPVEKLAEAFEEKADRQLIKFKLLGASIGLLTGILQVFFILLLKK
ncbi:DUF445 domain-containing protein [Ferruginibacter sp. HRS2-29]|uniref:DUF445 domain-containing protein n=1 Tax=Ferruginibacter sp. HRS2-29 TaxID=2487334 RepID=UPI0020CFB2AB|nr:hypothetical protein [Ferruginibacter sp. HRS2-29]